jgi:hypothetical protein
MGLRATKPDSNHRGSVTLALFLLALPLAAQQYTHLSGLILDSSEAGVPGSMVAVVNEDTGFRRIAWSRPDGGYTVSSLEPGVYKITVRKAGFRTVIRFGVKLDVSQPARLDFRLAIGSMQEAITVDGAPALLNSEDGSVGTLVGRDEIENLPLNGRGLISLLELAPGTVLTPATRGESGQFSANGQRPNTHYFTVDGVSANTGVSAGGLPAQATGGSLPGMTAFGSLHSLISLAALDEFRVQTSSAIPEFGRLPGAQVSLSSRSGSNDFRGSLLYFFRHEWLNANDWFGNSQGDRRAPVRMSDFSASAGGPIRRDRTFFFLAYEGMRLRQPGFWRTPVPTLAARQALPDWVQPVLNLFPAANGQPLGDGLAQWTGRNNRPSRLDAGSARVDHALTSRLTAFVRFSESPSANEFGSTQISQLNLSSRSFTIGLNARPRPDIVLDTRVNASDATAHSRWRQLAGQSLPPCYFQPLLLELRRGDCSDLIRFSIAGVGDVVYGQEGDRSQSQYQFSQTASLNRSSHAMRLGFDYLRLAPKRHDVNGTLSVFADSLPDLNDSRNLWRGTSSPQYLSDVLTEFSMFAQDTWRATPKLALTYGVRWEVSTSDKPKQDVLFLDPVKNLPEPQQGHSVWEHTYGNVAPRIGIAYRPGSEGKTVLRAGAGLYYDSSVSIATDLINDGPLSLQLATSGINGIFSTLLSFGFVPNLRLPRVANWSGSVERAIGTSDVVSISYVGSVGRDLLRRELGGPGTTDTTWVVLATNHGDSHYHGLQVEYRRRPARALEARVAYSWSHSIDDSSTDSLIHWNGGGQTASRDRGSSDFDVRHALTAAFTYEIRSGRARVLRDWAMDGIFRSRTSFPLTVLNSDHYQSLEFANAFRPNLVLGQPVWINDSSAPAGRRLNAAAFQSLKSGVEGNLGRNAISGFGMSQLDLALRREFRLGERRALQLRVEAFNVMNQANFADPVPFLVNPLFGQSVSMLNMMLGTGSPASGLAPMFQIGGARTVELALRVRF